MNNACDILERGLVGLAIVIVMAGGAVCIQPECFPTQDQRLVKQILEALEVRRADSYSLASEYLARPGSGPLGIAMAADAAAISFDHQRAIELYRMLPVDGGRWEFLAEMGIARRCEVQGRLTEEERHLRRALELNKYDIEANSRLGHLLQVTGRSWEGIPYFHILIRRGKCRGDELVGLAAPERFFRSDDHLEVQARNSNPPEVLPLLAIARREMYENRPAEAEALLRKVIDVAPQLGEAQGRLGRILYDRGDPDEFLQWRARLPNEAKNHPEVWFVQGMQARRLGQVEGAVRCFLETLTLSPNHIAANLQIAACLDQLNHPDIAKEFVRYGENMASLEAVLNVARNDPQPAKLHQAVTSFAEVGRFWEAAGWAYAITHLLDVPVKAVRGELRHWLTFAMREPRPNADRFNPASRLRIGDFPEPRWGDGSFSPNEPPARGTASSSDDVAWQFRDEAQSNGISFRYFEGTTEATRLQHIFNVVGGGMAAIDYDLDGWCDLYLAQANNWQDPAPQPDYSDRLFRNGAGEPFRDVTVQAGLGDLSFTHGITAGDFDQDGFPDLYLGNLGANRLYRNNGDGTFTDTTTVAGVAGNEWTTSSVFADFSGDGLPDLYVANYSEIEETTRHLCKRNNGELMACTPDLLPAEFHRFYLNRGDGSFRDVTFESGMRQPNGRGLGLVAWDFDGDGRLGLFVGNDTSANFLFTNAGSRPDGIPLFQQDAVVRGVAFDLDGNSQACMGIATGDANGDGQLDMFVTNFFGESNTLYSQRGDGLFDDATRACDLRDTSFWKLGFGTQFADFDGDGWEDLIVTNGHVDQQSSRGDPDRTPPQVFRNLQGRKFEEISADRLGPFFQTGYLGRGLARLDWNRDGRPDFAVSHLHGDFALVTNSTPSRGRPLVVRLAGRSGVREPTGARMKIRADGRDVHRLLTAGDGYLVANDRCIHFSIPNAQSAVELEVHWPGGLVQRWSQVRSGQEILVIEGRKQPVVLKTFDENPALSGDTVEPVIGP
jgi:tetratricopeptide (TPR) repeat protein